MKSQELIKNLILIIVVAAFIVLIKSLFVYTSFYSGPDIKTSYTNISVPISLPEEFSETPNLSSGKVLFDVSHNNNFEFEELEVLFSRIISRSNSIAYFNGENELEKELKNVNSFVIISPRGNFSKTEIEIIKKFLDRGGRLMILSDPEKNSLVNRLAINFDIIIQENYLYNLKENDGNFRHIYLKHFSENAITKNLKKITLYSSCSIIPSDKGLVFTDNNTYSSTENAPGRYSPIILKQNNILTLCDQTFIQKPYNKITDNNKLISNLADWLTKNS